MGKAKIFGIRPYSFKDEKTEREISGCSLYIGELTEGVTGLECSKQSINTDLYNHLVKQAGEPSKLVNRECEIVYDKRGKIVGASIVQ